MVVKNKDSSGMAEFYAVLSDAYKGKVITRVP